MCPSNDINLPKYRFPPIENADKQGLLSIGGDLHPERILDAYHQGIFPWYEPGCPILWWSPNPRLVLFPKQLKLHRSLKQSLQKPYQLKIDCHFESVIHHCANSNAREGHTWISPEMIAAYCELHVSGFAHSFEIWQDKVLIGGLYGLSLGKAFFGESMFHLQRDASKIALFELSQFALAHDFHFIDCQLPNAHLQRLGASLMHRKEFQHRLREALQHPHCQGTWKNHSPL